MSRVVGMVLLCLALAGCGSTVTTTRTSTVHRPPNLGPPGDEAQAGHSASGCGVERWAVKTLTDPGANQVKLTPVPSTVAALIALPAPVNPTDRVAPTETTTFRLSGTIVFAKQEADGDIHLVLEDAAGRTMIVESPKASCATGSVVLRQITAVRKAVDAKFGTTATAPYSAHASYTVHVPVVVTGVGFFDRLHGQTGVARNGAELHPLLSISFTSGAARAAGGVPDLHLREHPSTD